MGMEVSDNLDRMIVLDYLIGNTDRHFRNFGLIRDADSLEWIGSSPLFDCGASLGYNVLTENLSSYRPTPCKPFRDSFHDQLMLVKDMSWIDPYALDDALSVARKTLDEIWDDTMDERKRLMMDLLRRNSDRLKRISRA